MAETRIEVRYADGLDARELIQRGVELCRQNDWTDGVAHLAALAGQKDIQLPPYYYGYLGHGVIRLQRRSREGIALCKKAVKRGYADPDNHYNLARSYWLLGKRKPAVSALEAGMRIDRAHPGLSSLREEMGYRRPPVIKFLSRDNFLNQYLGRRRHQREESD